MKIFIFGPPGSGKSYAANYIARVYGIPHFDLDKEFWRVEHGQKLTGFRERTVGNILSQDRWILEGMYRDNWLEEVIKSADLIFLLTPPKTLMYFRVCMRTLKRMVHLEKHDRPSNIRTLWSLFRHIGTFDSTRLSQFQQRAPTCIRVRTIDEILEHLTPLTTTSPHPAP